MIVRNVRVDITPEAERRITELGLGEEMERVVVYTRESIPTLCFIQIETWIDYEETGEVRLGLTAFKDPPYVRRDPENWAWLDGVIRLTTDHFRRWCNTAMYVRDPIK